MDSYAGIRYYQIPRPLYDRFLTDGVIYWREWVAGFILDPNQEVAVEPEQGCGYPETQEHAAAQDTDTPQGEVVVADDKYHPYGAEHRSANQDDGSASHDSNRVAVPPAFPPEAQLQPNEYVFVEPYPEDALNWSVRPLSLPEIDNIPLRGEEYLQHLLRYDAGCGCLRRLKHFDPYSALALPGNPAIAAYIDALYDPSIDAVVVTGPAGSGKTYTAINYAQEMCIEKRFAHAFVLRSGRNPLGAVRGDIQRKMAPVTQANRDALRAVAWRSAEIQRKLRDETKFVGKPERGKGTTAYEQVEDIANLRYERNFTDVPYELADGRTLSNCVVIIDEAQRADPDVMDTLITRPGEHSKLILLGDTAQIPVDERRHRAVDGFTYGAELLRGAKNVAFITLHKVLRSPIAAVAVQNRSRVRAKYGLPV